MVSVRALVVGLLLALPAAAQNFIPVTASNITDPTTGTNARLIKGKLCFQATDSSDVAIPFKAGGNQQVINVPACGDVINGVVTGLTIANPANTNPAHIVYRITVLKGSAEVVRYTNVDVESQISAGAFSYDACDCSASTITPSTSVYATVYDESVALQQRTRLNFLGSGVTCQDNSSTQATDCTIPGGGGGAILWGDITGTLANQTDLQTALNAKVTANAGITGATKTKITYDAKGLVTAGADASFADITGAVTDAQVPNSITIDLATAATTTTVTDDTTTNATMYPTWVTTASGNQSQKVSSTKFSFNPSTGTVTATTFAGALSGNATTATALAANGANCAGNNFALGVDASGVGECAQPAFSNLSGAATKGQLPGTTVYTDQANTFGAFLQIFQAGNKFDLADPTDGTKLAQFDVSNIATSTTRTVNIPNANSTTIQADTGAANNFLTAVSAQGVISKAQPGFSNLSGAATDAQVPDSITLSQNSVTDYFAFTNIAAPGSPAAGVTRVFVDSTDKRLHDKNDAGAIGTTVVADTGAANNYISAISAAGAITKSRPACATLSDSAASCATDATNATNIGSGTLADGRLSANVALYNNGSKTWGGGSAFTWTFDGGANTDPTLVFTSGVTPSILTNGVFDTGAGATGGPGIRVGTANNGIFINGGTASNDPVLQAASTGYITFATETYGRLSYIGTGVTIQGLQNSKIGWAASTSEPTTGADLAVSRGAAGVFDVGTGAAQAVDGTVDAAVLDSHTANGGLTERKIASELITLATGATTTDSSANLLPANSIILAVGCRITTTITTAANWSVGDATTAARFSSANSTLTVNTTSVGLNQMKGAVATDAAGPVQISAAKLRITTNVNPGAGAVRCDVHYISFTAPTS